MAEKVQRRPAKERKMPNRLDDLYFQITEHPAYGSLSPADINTLDFFSHGHGRYMPWVNKETRCIWKNLYQPTAITSSASPDAISSQPKDPA